MNNQYVWIAITAVAFVGGLEIGYAISMNNDPYVALTRNPESMNRFANQLMISMMNSSQHQKMMNNMMSGNGMGMQSGSMGMQSGSMGMQSGSMGMQSGSMGMQSGSMGMQSGSMGMQSGYKTTVNQTTNTTKGFNQTSMLERGNVAMGFNQTKIHHHFMATTTGGEIMIMSTDTTDMQTINEIRSHVKDIQYEFSQGNFSKPFYIHDQVVPGTDVLTAKKDLIHYSIKDIDGGSVLILTTNDTEVLNAIPQFMNFQSSQHMGH